MDQVLHSFHAQYTHARTHTHSNVAGLLLCYCTRYLLLQKVAKSLTNLMAITACGDYCCLATQLTDNSTQTTQVRGLSPLPLRFPSSILTFKMFPVFH